MRQKSLLQLKKTFFFPVSLGPAHLGKLMGKDASLGPHSIASSLRNTHYHLNSATGAISENFTLLFNVTFSGTRDLK